MFHEIRKGITWPGDASTEVCIIFFDKSEDRSAATFNENSDTPPQLLANEHMSFVGCAIQGMGFVVEEDTATFSLEKDVVKPFIISDDLNNSPTSSASRDIIFFRDMELKEAQRFPNALEYVQKRVKPYRDTVNRKAHRERWWRFGDWRPGLYKSLEKTNIALCVGITAKYASFNFVSADVVFDQTTVVFPTDSLCLFSIVSSILHTEWSRLYGGKKGKSPRYNPTRCFETFPLPLQWQSNSQLEHVGHEYYEYRAALMVERGEGLTKTYNRFHAPEETDPGTLRLRELHGAMDAAVLRAYGWSDLVEAGRTACEFVPDYYEEPVDGGDPVPKSVRYRWSDATRDEVLARLLALNAERAAAESAAGTASAPTPTRARRGARSAQRELPTQNDLFT